MGDLEQYEVRMLRLDAAIQQYDDWWYNEGAVVIAATRFETLLSWKQELEHCSRCDKCSLQVKVSTDGWWRQLACGHYRMRFDVHYEYDEEIGWVPKY